MQTHHEIDTTTCNGCGACAEVCAAHLFAVEAKEGRRTAVALPERAASCMRCGHCMAVCPSGSLRVEGLAYGRELTELPPPGLGVDELVAFLSRRRSVRVFTREPVAREALERIVEIVALAPMGYTPHKVAITVVPTRARLERALPIMVGMYEQLGRWAARPVSRFFLRRKLNRESYNALMQHVLPGMRWRLPETRAGLYDTIMRGAPAMLLFHAHREAGKHSDDIFIAVTYALLAAHALGLGATAIGLVPPVVERSAELRELFRIPKEHEVLASVIVGHPKVKFRRAIKRELAGVRFLDEGAE